MVKKKSESISRAERLHWIDKNPNISISRQCELLNISRSSWYYKPVGESEENLRYMRLLDEQYLKTPFYGVRRMTAMLQRQGYEINHKRVQRLMQLMGIRGISPQRQPYQGSERDRSHKIYPYLLRGLEIARPNQVCLPRNLGGSTDITYIGMANGFLYLCAVIDWYSRYVLSWGLSNTMDTNFCLEVLNDALSSGYTPEIFNTDQGSQFTSTLFTSTLLDNNISISMDGKGRALDNIFVERLWKSVKYEDIFIKNYENGITLRHGLKDYWTFYNTERPHQSLDYMTPKEFFEQSLSKNQILL